MTLQSENEQELDLGFDWEALAKQVAEKALEAEQCPYEAEVSLTLTDNQEIRRLNREFRDIDRPTDVLSFPLVNFQKPADYAVLDTQEADCFNPETGELMLGDIVISVEKAMEQGREYGHGIKREFAFLVAHSMLHLLGYDHMVPEEASVMEAKQEAILDSLGIRRLPPENSGGK